MKAVSHFGLVCRGLVAGVCLGIIGVSAPTASAAPPVRHFEMVTPVDKRGNSVQPGSVLSGDRLLFRSSGSLLENDQPFGQDAFYVARSSGAGWVLGGASFSSSTAVAGFDASFTQQTFLDRATLVAADQDLPPGAQGAAGLSQLDVYQAGAFGFRLVSTGSVGGNGPFDAFFEGQSADGAHVVFGTEETLEPEDAGRSSGPQLYERVGDETRVVALDDNQVLLNSGGAVLGGYELSPVGAIVSGGVRHAVSDDGSRIFFESPCPVEGFTSSGYFCPAPDPAQPAQVYLREHGDTTTLVSASKCTRAAPVCEDVGPARFDGAASDGSRVYFRTPAQLIDSDIDANVDLYMYDVDEQTLRGVSVGQEGAGPAECDDSQLFAGVCGVTVVSDDGKRVYFTATGALDGANPGMRNLYMYDASGDDVALVTQLAPDEEILGTFSQQGLSRQDTVRASLTPDGATLVFQSDAQLTAADTEAASDVYRYDADDGTLTCVSCSARAAPGANELMLPRLKSAFNTAPGAAQNPNRFVADDGDTVVFQTKRALLAGDSNGQVDIYEWHDGQLALITPGTDDEDTQLMGISGDGSDVFFTSPNQLAATDVDSNDDIYTARRGPAPPPLIAFAPCQGDVCQGPAAGVPPTAVPGSGSFRGRGNLRPAARPTLRLRALSRKGRTRLAHGQTASLRVFVNRAGHARVAGRARIARRMRVVISAAARAGKQGVVDIPMRLSKLGLRALRRGRALRIRLSVRFSRVPGTQRLSFKLRDTRGRHHRADRRHGTPSTSGVHGSLLAIVSLILLGLVGLDRRGRLNGRPAARRHVGTLTVGAAAAGALVFSASASALSVVPAGQPGGFVAETASTQAGAHADAVTNFTLTPPSPETFGASKLKDSIVDLPAGLVGNPEATPKCKTLISPEFAIPQCPVGSQVGTAELTYSVEFFPGFSLPVKEVTPVFNMARGPNQVADLAFVFVGAPVPVHLSLSLRPNDYGVRVTTHNASTFFPIQTVKVNVWGVPGDASHDVQRCMSLNPEDAGDPFNSRFTCISDPNNPDNTTPQSVSGARHPFLTNPTACDAPKETRITMTSWDAPGVWSTPESAFAPTPTGCENLKFEPSIEVRPDSSRADSPSGYQVDVSVPQNDDPDGLATALLRDATVTLPQGVTLSPSAADGLKGCTDAEVARGTDNPVQCSDGSKVGTVEVETPVLPGPLTGNVYVGQPIEGDKYRIFLVMKGFGVLIKLKGSVHPDPVTGQLTTTVVGNPQLPFSKLSLRFNGGPRAPLANPPTCGEKTATATFTSWAGQSASPTSTFVIACPGMSGFSPAFSAGLVNPTAGAFSTFALGLARPDGQEFLDGVNVELPTGLVAKIKGMPLCGPGDAAEGTCPIESRIGTATVGAGPGTAPFYLQGSVSLTEGYRGAPYGLSISVHAIAGPYDLGTVVVRQAVFVDPIDAHITVVSDPLPTILDGIPIRLRSVSVDVDRPEFTVAPTSCAEKQIKVTLHSQQGSTSGAQTRFQVGDCASLALKPRVAMRLIGRKQTRDGGHPGLRVKVRQKAGQSNLKRVQARLPLTLALDPDNARALCEFEDGERVNCPAASIIGRATAVSPLLNQPLSGPVYFVKGVRTDKRTGRKIRTLPTLLIPLRGEIALDLRAKSTVRERKLVSTFSSVPDAALSRFTLNLQGGKNGILVVTGNRNVCRGKQVTELLIDGQTGKRSDQTVTMRRPCKKPKSKKKRR